MFNVFKNKKNKNSAEPNIVVIKKSRPHTGGGTDATQDLNAPKEILSNDMIVFKVSSAVREISAGQIGYISAFALKTLAGSFVFYEKSASFRRSAERQTSFALIKEDVFPSLVKVVNEYGLAKNNGFHSKTHGLPENFGGDIFVFYSSGEKISASNNQSPVISRSAAIAAADLFSEALNAEKCAVPNVSALKEVRFENESATGTYKKAVLSVCSDGSALIKTTKKYSGGEVFEDERTVSPDGVEDFKRLVSSSGILLLSSLPDLPEGSVSDSGFAFIFEDGSVVKPEKYKYLPEKIGSCFYKIEHELMSDL